MIEMPQIGEIKYGREIGKLSPEHAFIWAACEDCGKERWVYRPGDFNKQRTSQRCQQCSRAATTLTRQGNKNPNWRGGLLHRDGYILVKRPEHRDAQINGYVAQHRLILEGKLGRPLLPEMFAHHINGIRDDNRPENLEEISPSEHVKLHLHTKADKWQKKVELTGSIG